MKIEDDIDDDDDDDDDGDGDGDGDDDDDDDDDNDDGDGNMSDLERYLFSGLWNLVTHQLSGRLCLASNRVRSFESFFTSNNLEKARFI